MAEFSEKAPGPTRDASSYKARIAWGDGTQGPGIAKVVTRPAKGGGTTSVIEVLGAHTYTEAGYHGVVVTLARPGVVSSTTTIEGVSGTTSDSVVDAPRLSAKENGSTGRLAVATFVDHVFGAVPPVGDDSARISWGDGTRSRGTVAILSGSIDYYTYTGFLPDGSVVLVPFSSTVVVQVSGRHKFGKEGIYGVDITLAGPQSSISATSILRVT